MSLTSGLLTSIDLAIVFITVVLPAFGGDTMMPRWPLPIGDTRSMIRATMLVGSRRVLQAQALVGEQRRQVLEPGARRGAASGSPPLTVWTSSSAGFFSLRPAGRLSPVMWSPLRRPYWRASLTGM